MICSPTDPGVCHYPVLLGRRGWFLYHAERNERLCEAIKARAVQFWENHVVKDIPPTDSEPTLDVVEHLKRIPKTTVVIPMDVMVRFGTLDQAVKDAEKARTPARADLLKHMGDAEAVDAGDAGGATYLEQSREGFNLTQFKKDHPDLAAKYITESRYRVLRQTKPK